MEKKLIKLQAGTKWTSIILPMLLVISNFCFSQYTIKSHYDKYDDFKIFEIDNNFLTLKNLNSNTSIRLDAYCFLKSNVVVYRLKVQYYSSDWLFIGAGESLVLLIDGKRLGFTGNGSSGDREVLTGTGVAIKEIAYYPITKEEFEQIAKGELIEIKLSGDKYFIECMFNKWNKQAFRIFYDNYVNKSADELNKMPLQKERKLMTKRTGGFILLIAVLTLLIIGN